MEARNRSGGRGEGGLDLDQGTLIASPSSGIAS
jgi:hypothetical protein